MITSGLDTIALFMSQDYLDRKMEDSITDGPHEDDRDDWRTDEEVRREELFREIARSQHEDYLRELWEKEK